MSSSSANYCYLQLEKPKDPESLRETKVPDHRPGPGPGPGPGPAPLYSVNVGLHVDVHKNLPDLSRPAPEGRVQSRTFWRTKQFRVCLL